MWNKNNKKKFQRDFFHRLGNVEEEKKKGNEKNNNDDKKRQEEIIERIRFQAVKKHLRRILLHGLNVE
jgi:hypothetical protein